MTYDYAIGIRHDEPPRTQPYIDHDPPIPPQPCPSCARHFDAELARWKRLAYALADAEAYHRESRERLIADLATANQANEALRRTIDRLRHYDDPQETR